MPSCTTRSALSRPSHVYETRPAGSRRLRTTVRIDRPLAVEDVERHGLATPQDERDHREVPAHSHTGEKTRSTFVPVIGLRSSFSRSVTAKAAAVAPSKARTIRSWGHRANARKLQRV